jgi:hypothetical protein
MRNVIRSVQNSLLMFVDAIEGSGLQGTISLVTFQDSVGVNVTFQQPAPAGGTERSPFFAPVPIDNPGQVEALRDFINTLEANMGYDAPENLAGAIDFARNNVIGYTGSGQPNVVGDHVEDPPDTAPFPGLSSDRQVFVAFTDITFHSDSRDEDNSSLLAPFVPRDIDDILASLVRTGTVVNISDPARVDETVAPTGASDEVHVDADYWAIQTGGAGEDVAAGYSIVDLEVVVVGGSTGLLDITLDRILQSTCYVDFNASLSVDAQVEFTITESDETFTGTLDFHWF